MPFRSLDPLAGLAASVSGRYLCSVGLEDRRDDSWRYRGSIVETRIFFAAKLQLMRAGILRQASGCRTKVTESSRNPFVIAIFFDRLKIIPYPLYRKLPQSRIFGNFSRSLQTDPLPTGSKA